MDINPPDSQQWLLETGSEYIHCDVTSWTDLRHAFNSLKHVDKVFANAGISEHNNFLEDIVDSDGALREPSYEVLDVNVRAVFNTVKLAWSAMRRQKSGGSIVITTSATAYAPEQSLPVYSASKLAVSGGQSTSCQEIPKLYTFH